MFPPRLPFEATLRLTRVIKILHEKINKIPISKGLTWPSLEFYRYRP